MNTTPDINTALAKLQGRLPRISKDLTAKVQTKTGGNYTYSYADLSLISREVLPLLSEVGLSFTARPTMVEGRFVLAYELRHTSGEYIDGVYPLPGNGSPQEIGSAITYARRYCLCAVTGVAPDDEDHDAIVAEKAERRRRREGSQPKQAPANAAPPMNADQQKRLQRAFELMGVEAKEKRLAFAVGVVGRKLRTASEMTAAEAELVVVAAEKQVELPEAGGDPA